VLAARGVSLVNRSTGARPATSRAAKVVLLVLPFRRSHIVEKQVPVFSQNDRLTARRAVRESLCIRPRRRETMAHRKTPLMKRSSTAFLQIVIVLIGMGALAFMLWEPHLEGRNAHATVFEVYFKDPFLAYA
jgi:hypothetical protein